MGSLHLLSSPVILSMIAAICAMLAGQVLHFFLMLSRSQVKRRVARALYEVLLGVTMGLWASACAHVAAVRRAPLDIRFWLSSIPAEPLTWLAGAACVMALLVFLTEKRPWVLLEAVVLALAAPPMLAAIAQVGGAMALGLLLGQWSFFGGRTIVVLVRDRRSTRRKISWFSATEALARMPAGVLVVEETGAVRLMNDAMRAELGSLDLPGDLGEALPVAAAASSNEPWQRVVPVTGGEYRLVTEHRARLAGRESRMIVSVDVTENQRVNRALEQANEELETVGEKLRCQLASLDQVAREESLARARSRVHDIIGQRLSTLHRYLEDGDVSHESIMRMAPLLTSIMEDLAADTEVELKAELEGVASAFALVNVDTVIEGSLPQDPEVGSAFVSIVREAMTNGVRHGQATRVRIDLDEGDGQWRLRVENNGTAPKELPDDVVGTGITAMRSLVTSLGGNLTIASLEPFILAVEVPQRTAV